MLPGTERLMPWRTLIEVARRMNAKGKNEAAICSAQVPDGPRQYDGVTIYTIDPSPNALCDFVKEGSWDVLFYPVTYRQGLWGMNYLTDIPAEIIAYIPGGINRLFGELKLISEGHFNIAKPYLLDTLTPHKWLANRLHKAGVDKIVCQSPLTALDAVKNGWKRDSVYCAIPGKDTVEGVDDSLVQQLGLKDKCFLLFSGSPAPVRGAIMALQAFDRVASRIPGVRFVMLMRCDINSDFREIENAKKSIKNIERVIFYQERVSREQLFGMFRTACAVLLPFLIVPSEIPLTFFEVMNLGTPVLTYENGGTTDYLKEGLKIVRRRSIKSLGDAIVSICRDQNEHRSLSQKAKALMYNHPTWEQTAEVWEKSISGQNV